MDVRKLEAFCKVYELRSFSKAGKELYLSQPTISSHILNLEDELNVQLFDRLGRQTIPTEAAEILYSCAKDVFESLDNVRSEIQLLRDNVVGNLCIGGSTIPAHYIIPKLISGFCLKHPEVSFNLSVGDTEDILSRIQSGEFVLGVVGIKPEKANIASRFLLEDDMIIVASRDQYDLLFAGKEKWALAELAQYPWVMREKGSGTRAAFEKAISGKASMQNFNVRAWVGSTGAVLECVLAGVGLSVTSRLAAGAYLDRNEIVVVPVPELVARREFHLAYMDKRGLFPAAKSFVEFASKQAEKLTT